MRVRKARPADWPEIFRLAQKYGLDYPGMEADEFWVAVERGGLAGIVGLKTHPDAEELCALGVEERWRGRSLGRLLVRAAVRQAHRNLYLATVIPEFFSRFGFKKADAFPPSIVKDPQWCAGCDRSRCTKMTLERR